MRIHRRWSSCAVLLAAMLVVSCAEGQFGQVMQNVGKSMVKGMCAEGNGPASAAPEFCLYVTELRLLGQDTQADVSLLLVNRTGRRIFVSVPDNLSFYLTDSSGAKWSAGHGDYRGIPMRGYGPTLPLEPGVDAPISVQFRRQGQAPGDPSFSLRGEIAISKVDSRGEPVGYEMQVARGLSISGIRLVQESQQSAQPLQQKASSVPPPTVVQGTSPGTNGAAISAGAPAVAPPKVVPLAPPVGPNSIVSPAATTVENSAESIVGMNLGMNVDEIRSAIKAYDPSFQISEKKVQLPGMPNSESVSFFYSWAPGGSGNEENIYVAFIPPPNKNLASIIAREQSFQPEKRLLLSSLQHALIAKYGQPTMKSTLAGGGGEIYTWLLEGKGSSVPGLEQYKKNFCEHANLGEVYDYVKLGGNILSSINRNKLKKDCGKALTILMGVAFNQKDLVQSVISVLVDNPFIDSAFRETDVFLAERDKKQRVQDADRAGRLGKPKL